MSNLNQFKKFAKGSKQITQILGLNSVIYTRVSSKEQAETNKSLEWQKKYCEDYAGKNSLRVLGYFGGTYESAMTDERKEFNRMIKFVKNVKEKVSCILVYSLDRFSRSGENAIYISSELQKQGIRIIAVTQPMDTSTHSGTLQQNIHFIFSKYDNDLRRQKCVDGMREKLKRGDWLGAVPTGYSYDRSNGNHGQKGAIQKIIINEKGEILKKAFYWKLEGLSHPQIIDKLKTLGLTVPIQTLTDIFRNPFYCGFIAHNFLEGELIVGNHPPLISQEIFKKVNNMNKPDGYHQIKENENLPLRQFMHHSKCGTTLTGYLVVKKKLYYYKCNKRGCKCNKSAKSLHYMFIELLKKYRVDSTYVGLLKEQLELTYLNLTEKNTDLKKVLTVELNAVQSKLNSIRERFAIGEIDRNLHDEMTAKFNAEKTLKEAEIEKTGFRVSNLQKLVEYTVTLSTKLHTTWQLSDYTEKQNLQKTIFPEGLQYNRESDDYRTPRVNRVFEFIACLSGNSDNKKNGSFDYYLENSRSVPRVGIEPT